MHCAAAEGEAAAAVKCFEFRDLRAEAGTDKADATDMREAQQQLGHNTLKQLGPNVDGSPTRARTWDLRINSPSIATSN